METELGAGLSESESLFSLGLRSGIRRSPCLSGERSELAALLDVLVMSSIVPRYLMFFSMRGSEESSSVYKLAKGSLVMISERRLKSATDGRSFCRWYWDMLLELLAEGK